jgi:hypothetical protein
VQTLPFFMHRVYDIRGFSTVVACITPLITSALQQNYCYFLPFLRGRFSRRRRSSRSQMLRSLLLSCCLQFSHNHFISSSRSRSRAMFGSGTLVCFVGKKRDLCPQQTQGVVEKTFFSKFSKRRILFYDDLQQTFQFSLRTDLFSSLRWWSIDSTKIEQRDKIIVIIIITVKFTLPKIPRFNFHDLFLFVYNSFFICFHHFLIFQPDEKAILSEDQQ